MWKLIIGFIIFAALSLFVILQGGDKIDMGGEKHGGDSHAAILHAGELGIVEIRRERREHLLDAPAALL